MASKAAHVLTDRQKKGSLAMVMKRQKQPKNVLVRNDIDCWPSLNDNQSESFVKLLQTYCAEPGFLKNLSIGLESTKRNLKKQNEVKFLVIADEISPKWFGKHLIAMALHRSQSLRIIIVPSLKEKTRNIFKAPSIIFSIRKAANVTEIEAFYDNELGYHSKLLQHYCKIKTSTNVAIKKKKKQKPSPDGPQVTLLSKTSDFSRAFIPMDTEIALPAPEETISFSSDFISLSKYTDKASSLVSKSPEILYRPIKIKKILGNPNRKTKS